MKKRKHKTLRFKKEPETFGVIMDFPGGPEIFHSEAPTLQPVTATEELMRQLYANHPEILKRLEDYELIDVMVSFPRENKFLLYLKKNLPLLFKSK